VDGAVGLLLGRAVNELAGVVEEGALASDVDELTAAVREEVERPPKSPLMASMATSSVTVSPGDGLSGVCLSEIEGGVPSLWQPAQPMTA
jgi:hypothetical protein